MGEFHESGGPLRKAVHFLLFSLLPGLLFHAFPCAMLVLAGQTFFLVAVNHYGTRLGISTSLLLFLCGSFFTRLLLNRLRTSAIIHLVCIFSAALLLLILLPNWLCLILSGVTISGLFLTRSREQRRYMIAGATAAALAGFLLGAAWFSPLADSPALALCALAALSVFSVWAARSRLRSSVFLGVSLLVCLACVFAASQKILTEIRTIGIRWTYTPYGVLYSMESNHGRKIFDACGHLLKNGDIPVLRMSVLPAVLQCQGENNRVLYVGYTPSEIPGLLLRMPNVRKLEVLSFSGDFARKAVTESPVHALERFRDDFDLIFVAELPPCDHSARHSFLNLLKDKLREDGVLVTAKDSRQWAAGDGAFPETVADEPLPGSHHYMTIFRQGGENIRTWEAMEKQFRELCTMTGGERLSPALLDALKSESEEPEERAVRQSSLPETLHYSLSPVVCNRILTGLLIAYGLLRLLLGRRGQLHFCFLAMENGFSLAVMLLAGICLFARFGLEYSSFPPALLMLIFLGRVQTGIGWLQRVLRGGYFLALCYLALPFLRTNFDPRAVLIPLLLLGAAGSGVVQAGISIRGKSAGEMDRIENLLGAIIGALLFALEPYEYTHVLMVFALFCRVLYLIRM